MTTAGHRRLTPSWGVPLGMAAAAIGVAAAALTAFPAPIAAAPAPAVSRSTVFLLGPPRARLLLELRRELAASGFTVIERVGAAANAALDGALPPGATFAVVVHGPSRVQVRVGDRPGRPPALRADLTVDPTDRHARRRACLAVVEYLRFGSPDDPPAPGDPSSASASSSANDPSARDPSAPGDPSAPADPSTAHDPSAAGAEPPMHALSLRTPGAAPDSALPFFTLTAAPAFLTTSVLDAADPAIAPRGQPWALAAATTVNFDSGMGEPTSHVQLTAQLPLRGRWAATVTGLWPLLGAQLQTDGRYVRMWTMGLSGGLRYTLPRPTARLQPYLGLALGARFVLSDSESIETRVSRVVLIPSATVGASAGLLLELRPLVHLLFEGNAAWMGMLPLTSRAPFEAAAARGRAAHAALGVLFEY